MVKTSRVLLLAIILSAAPALARTYGTVAGKTPEELFPWAELDPAIPTQEQVTGVVPGSRPLRHAELMHYLDVLAASSPRASIETYAESHEGRRLVAFAVGDPATIDDLDGFRAEHAQRIDPRGRSVDDDAIALADAKAVAWMAYGIHGDELSSVDAASALAYWLVAGEDDRAQAIRENLLVLIDPMENPDGRDRYLAQTASFAHKVPNPDQDDLSHRGVWPWGRGNHYLFDLNRDFFTMIHPESRRSHLISAWNPQLVLDCHEMGDNDTYLFSPARHPFNPLLPDFTHTWADRFAADQAVALDQRGYGYYTGEWNEEFFPGYGSSWSSYLGAIGILYEMSGTAGTVVRRRDGSLRTYGEALEHQVTSSVANLETLAENRVALLTDFVAARRQAIASPKGPARAWLLPPGRTPARTDALAEVLQRQGIEVLQAGSPVSVKGLRDIRTGESADRKVPAGTWMIPLDQPLSPLASVMLDPHVPMTSTYLREEREYIERGDGSRLYDTTAWSLPLLYGIDAYWTATKPAGDWSSEAAPPLLSGRVETSSNAYGYLLSGHDDASMAALAQLLQQAVVVQVADEPFGIGGRSYERGALLVRHEGNPDDLVERLQAISHEWGVTFHAVTTAQAESGPDLGGQHFETLRMPKVGVVTGMMVSPSDYGSVWYVLDERVGLRFNGVDVSSFSFLDLERYNVLVFPPAFGGASGYRRALGDKGVEALAAWIRAGGTAIGLDGGAHFLADKDAEITSTRLRRQALDTFPPMVMGASARAAAVAGPMRALGITASGNAAAGTPSSRISPVIGPGARPFAPGAGTPDLTPTALADWVKPLLPAGKTEAEESDLSQADGRLRSFAPQGSLLRAELAPRHWMSWGLPAEITVLFGTSSAFVTDGGAEVVARFPEPERMHLGGLLWPEAVGRLAHTAYAAREKVGDGQVILFLDHPTFRAWTLDTQRMFVNAVLYGPGLGTNWPVPW